MSKLFENNEDLETHRDHKVYLQVSFGVYSGMLLGQKTVAKYMRLHKKFLHDTKQLLGENLDDVRVSNWTLDYSDGKQRTVTYHSEVDNTDEKKLARIGLLAGQELCIATKKEDVFKFTDYIEAGEIVMGGNHD